MRSDESPWFVVIGASGREGLTDLRDLLGLLPAQINAVVMVVLHRPWNAVSQLQPVLAKATSLRVVVAETGESLERGTVYLGLPAEHLTLIESNLGRLVDDPTREYRNRTVDLLFASAAARAGACTIGVVLSGSLDDGSRGLAAIHAAGGLTMVLDRPPQADGMPENAIRYDGPIDVLGKLEEIAAAIRTATQVRAGRHTVPTA
ncbi:MAG: chemotaxis protein CheB [Tistlia sp.]|uniref:chemotaxis protein CheB n=1 Tax=Tistlia sp. TaxID=3057121 RepID=UPI0034A21BEC